jgi:hypothetical protein
MPAHSAATNPEPDDVDPEGEESVDAAETTDTGPGFMNRAARRAHAQGATPRRSSSASGQFGRKGTVQGPRQWGNRRSG